MPGKRERNASNKFKYNHRRRKHSISGYFRKFLQLQGNCLLNYKLLTFDSIFVRSTVVS